MKLVKLHPERDMGRLVRAIHACDGCWEIPWKDLAPAVRRDIRDYARRLMATLQTDAEHNR